MKVVHIIEALGGGVYTYFKDLSSFFGTATIKENIDTYVIYSSKRKEVNPAKIKQELSGNIKLIEISMVKELSPLQDLKSVYNIYKTLKKINPNVVHLHSSKAGVLGRMAYFFLFKKSKLFYTPHGYAFLKKDISGLHRKLYKFIEKYVQFFLGGTTIACGDTEYEIAKSMGKAKLVRNGISINEVNKYYNPVNNIRLKIGIVGRITFQKDPVLFNNIALAFPDYDFLWIGDGEMLSELTAPNIAITGWLLNPQDVLLHLNSLDVYMQTSLWEGLPIAVLEAMALKKPVVATNVIGNKDIVVNNETGFLFNEISELKDCFKILENKETSMRFGNLGFERCNALFNKDKNFTKLADLYYE